MKHFIIPDLQVKPGDSIEHITHIGKYLVSKKPDVVVCLGDFADMPSLSSYDKGRKGFEGRRYTKDIEAARVAMDALLKPIDDYNSSVTYKKYKPRLVMIIGNHEDRINRVGDLAPELDGIVSISDLPYDRWEVIPFLEVCEIDGVCYTHYLANPMSGKPYGGTAASQLKTVGKTFIVGHKQTLDIATRYLIDGSQQWGLICGAAYPHAENYKGPQGNWHWRGVVVAHQVRNGTFDPMLVSLDYLATKFGDVQKK